MTHKPYPAPHRLTLDDLDSESATTDALIARVRQHRQDEETPRPNNYSATGLSCYGHWCPDQPAPLRRTP